MSETTGQMEVGFFKSAFNMVSNQIHKQTVGRAQNMIKGFGMELSEKQTKKLGGYVLKIGQSFLMPIPSEDLIVDLKIKALTTSYEGYTVKLGGVKLIGAEVWLVNLSSWEGPTLQLKSLNIAKVEIDGEGVSATGSLSLVGLKIGAEGGNLMRIIGEVCAMSMVGAYSLGVGVDPVAAASTLKSLVISRLAKALETNATAKLSSLECEFDVTIGESEGGGKITAKDVGVGGTLREGEVEGVTMTGGLMVELGGDLSLTQDGLKVNVKVDAKAQMNVEKQHFNVDHLVALFDVDGDYAGVPTAANGAIGIVGLTVSATTIGKDLLKCVGEAVATAAADGYAALLKGSPEDVGDQLQPTLTEMINAKVATEMTSRFKAVIGTLIVEVKKAKYGAHDFAAKLEVSGVKLSGKVKEGEVTLSKPEANVAIDLGGSTKTTVDGLNIAADVAAKATLTLDEESLEVETLSADVIVSGTYSGVPTFADASLTVSKLKLASTTKSSHVLACITDACSAAATDALGSLNAEELDESEAKLSPTLTQRITEKLVADLKTQLKASADSIKVDIRAAKYGDQGGRGSIEIEDLQESGSIKEGNVRLRRPKGKVAIDLGGSISSTYDGLNIEAVVAAQAGLSDNLQSLVVPSLVAKLNITGKYGEVDTVAVGTITVANLALEAGAGKKPLLDCVMSACGAAATEAYASLKNVKVEEAEQQLPKTLNQRIMESISAKLSTTLVAKFDKVEVNIHSLNYGDYSVKGKVTGENVEVDVGIKGDKVGDVSFEGEINVTEVLVAWKASRLVDVVSLGIEMDEKGNGTVSGDLSLHGKDVGRFAESKLLKKLLKFRDGVKLSVPIQAHKLQLGGAKIELVDHSMIQLGVDKFILGDIRVTTRGPKIGKFTSKHATIEPTLKSPIMGDMTGKDLGELPEERGTKRILEAKQNLEKGSQGAINLQAWMQNVLQAQLDYVVGD